MQKSIFRVYDIRGVFGRDFTNNDVEIIGNSLGRFLQEDRIVIARDPRVSSEGMSEAFIRGFVKTGKSVVDIGMVPLGTGSLYALKRGIPYVYITGSHLSKEWNGIKLYYKSGLGFMEDDNNKIRNMALEESIVTFGNEGMVEKEDTNRVIDEYVEFMISKIKPKKKLKVLIDCGNGAAGVVARKLFERAGFEVDVIFEYPDGNFPNRSPDNFEDPLTEARKRVSEADFGVAYDGDGDRAVIIKRDGETITPEQTSYIILGELLQREDGPVVVNVECTRLIDDIAQMFGREVRRVRVGHTFLMDGVNRFNGSFGAERAGHYVIPSLVPVDDTLAVSYYFACLLSEKEEGLSEIMKKTPDYPFKRINLDCDDGKKFQVIENLEKSLTKEFSDINTIDGVRIGLENGWALMRASNTSPLIRLTVEGRTQEHLDEIRERFSSIVKEAIDSLRK